VEAGAAQQVDADPEVAAVGGVLGDEVELRRADDVLVEPAVDSFLQDRCDLVAVVPRKVDLLGPKTLWTRPSRSSITSRERSEETTTTPIFEPGCVSWARSSEYSVSLASFS
jgi:hypothetical protein